MPSFSSPSSTSLSPIVSKLRISLFESWPYLKAAFKASVAPIIALALTQVTPYAEYFGGYSYVACVSALLALPVFSFGRFLRLLVLEVLFTCLGAACTLLGIACTLAARPQPVPVRQDLRTGALEVPYDSNACFVSAVFMAAQILIIGSMRGKDPLLDYPCCCWMIVACFGLTYAPLLPNMFAGLVLVKQITTSLLIGYGLSFVAAVTLFPGTCRSDLKKSMSRYVAAIESTWDAYCNLKRPGSSPDTAQRLEDELRNLSTISSAVATHQQRALEEPSFDRLANADLLVCCNLLRATSVPLQGLCLIPETIRTLLHQECDNNRTKASYRRPCQNTRFFIQCNISDMRASLASIGVVATHRGKLEDEEAMPPEVSIDGPFDHPYLNYCEELMFRAFSQRVTSFKAHVQWLKSTKRLNTRKLVLPDCKHMNAMLHNANEALRESQKNISSYFYSSPGHGKSGVSPRVAFAVKMTCAVLCTALPAWFQHSQRFYIAHRLSWAQYAAGLAMQPSSGQSIFGFLLRLCGTAIGTLTSMAAWYAVVGNTAGCIILFGILEIAFLFVQFRLKERFATLGSTAAFTLITILGFQVEVQKLGAARVEASGSIVQDTLILGATRAGTIAGGLLVALFFTFFPYRQTERQLLQTKVGESLDITAQLYASAQRTSLPLLKGQRSPGRDHSTTARLQDNLAVSLKSIRHSIQFYPYDQLSRSHHETARFEKIAESIHALSNAVSTASIAAEAVYEATRNTASAWVRSIHCTLEMTDSPAIPMELSLTTASLALSSGHALPSHARATLSILLRHGAQRQKYLALMHPDHAAEAGYQSFVVYMIACRHVTEELLHVASGVTDIIGEYVLLQ